MVGWASQAPTFPAGGVSNHGGEGLTILQTTGCTRNSGKPSLQLHPEVVDVSPAIWYRAVERPEKDEATGILQMNQLPPEEDNAAYA